MSDSNPNWSFGYVPSATEWNTTFAGKADGPKVPHFDDPNNTSGLGVPAILRGTVSTYNLSGLTIGSGMSSGVRTANATALQNAINYAASNNKYFENVPGVYEIDSAAGLVVPHGTFFHWRGQGGWLQQFHSNAPILTIGDGSGAVLSSGFDIEGVYASYGADQTGQTSATGIVIGPMWLSKLSNLGVDGISTGHSAYTGISVVGSGSFFSNRITDLYVASCQQTLLSVSNQSTQNVWERVHLTQGGFSPAAIGGPALKIDSGGAAGNGSVFVGLNVEACKITGGTALIRLSGTRGMNMRDVHIENCGGTFGIFQLLDATLNIDGIDLLDCTWLAADGVGTNNQVFNAATNSPTCVTGLLMQWSGGGKIDQPLQIFGGSVSAEFPLMFSMRNFLFHDFGGNSIKSHLSVDPNLILSDYPAPDYIENYRYSPFYSVLEGAQFFLGDQNFTLYGQARNTFIWFPAALSVDRTLTLSNNMRSTSPGAGVVRQVGDTVNVYRGAGSATHNLLVKDGSGTTLTTSSTAGAGFTYVYNGTNFVAVT